MESQRISSSFHSRAGTDKNLLEWCNRDPLDLTLRERYHVPAMDIAPTQPSSSLADARRIPALRAAQAPVPETAPLLGSLERQPDLFRVSGRTPLDADRRIADRLAREPQGSLPGGKEGSERAQDPDAKANLEPSMEKPPGQATTEGTESNEDKDGLTEEEERQVKELKKRDAEVRAHEQAHMAAAGSLAQGGPRYTFQTGPDGKRYATGGEVNIVMKTGRTPEETIRNAQQVQAAALAASDPSPTDRQTAAAAARMAQEARQQLAAQSQAEASEKTAGAPNNTSAPNS